MIFKNFTKILSILLITSPLTFAMEVENDQQNAQNVQEAKNVKEFKNSITTFIKTIQQDDLDKKEALESFAQIITSPILYKKAGAKTKYNLDNIDKYIDFKKLNNDIKDNIIAKINTKNKDQDKEIKKAAIKILQEIGKVLAIAFTKEDFLKDLNFDIDEVKQNFDLKKTETLIVKIFSDEDISVDEITEAIDEENLQLVTTSFFFIKNYFNLTKLVDLFNQDKTKKISKLKLLNLINFKNLEKDMELPIGLFLFYLYPEIIDPELNLDIESPSLDELKKMIFPNLITRKKATNEEHNQEIVVAPKELNQLQKAYNYVLSKIMMNLYLTKLKINNNLSEEGKNELKGALTATGILTTGWLFSHGTFSFIHNIAESFEPQGTNALISACAVAGATFAAYKYYFNEPGIEKNIPLNVVERKIALKIADYLESLEKKQ